MLDWLRLLLMLFYAPVRGIRIVRDRALLAPALLSALLSQFLCVILTQILAGNSTFLSSGLLFTKILFQSALTLAPIALIMVPVLMLIANLFDRRGSFSVVLTQEYGSVASAVFYALTAVNVGAVVIAAFLHFSGLQATHVASAIQTAPQVRAMFHLGPEFDAQLEQQLSDPRLIAENLFRTIKFLLLGIWLVIAVRECFRVTALRAFAITLISGLTMFPLLVIWGALFSRLLGSPFLLLMLVLFLRGYVTDILRQQRAKASFKRNLEAATLNPADASAHYNIGLIHQQRGELEAARERFERAVQIDNEEVDSHYQLGRIARQQKRWADAIKHFEQVVARDPAHSTHEIWREVGATYVAAGQFEDAQGALERFLDRRESDPEGLYLMGRAQAGLGHSREATNMMEACINAVKTSPAYKYRLEKRWLNEAQQFIKTSRQETVSSRQ
jgi:tetratricopeptide (TPR) repeat protein